VSRARLSPEQREACVTDTRSVRAVAREMGVSRAAVHYWRRLALAREAGTVAAGGPRPVGALAQEPGVTRLPVVYPPGAVRPRTRAECPEARPCPWVSCRHHLSIDEGQHRIRLLAEPDALIETCALDVAALGGQTRDEVGALLGLTRERVRQIEAGALKRIRAAGIELGDYTDHEPVDDRSRLAREIGDSRAGDAAEAAAEREAAEAARVDGLEWGSGSRHVAAEDPEGRRWVDVAQRAYDRLLAGRAERGSS
jgi:transposase-like protein